MRALKDAWSSRTIRFAILIAILSGLEASLGFFTPYLTKETLGILGVAIATAVAILRILTSVPISGRSTITTSTDQ